jgi:outer membrane receptor protein involved in Fe transport
MLKRICLVFTVLLLIGQVIQAQVTTSSLTGTVKDAGGQPLSGATIVAVHQPSGTRYSTATQANGQFTIAGMQVGGPYSVQVTYVGYKPQRIEDVYLKLAESFVLPVAMDKAAGELEQVVVTSTAGRSQLLNAQRTGAATNLGRRQIETLPSITRSINDLARLTPQANGQAVGGGNYRQNFITVDGSDFNNAFGIGGNLPAGGAPISLDALEEISVNITPFDVRQSGFIGSSLNAVTRAGTNSLNASVYTYFRTEDQQGNKVGKDEFLVQRRDFKQYGARVGGPIIKNKLFFFLNYEDEKDIKPGQQKFASTSTSQFGSADNIARPTAAELDAISAFLKQKYGYETGPYQGYDFQDTRRKYLARVDWNISGNHRLNVRYSNVQSKFPSFPSTSLGSTGITNAQGNRQDIYALHFKNSNYFQENNFYSIAAELNSTFGKVANNLRFSRNNQNEPRSVESSVFPFVDILKDGRTFTSFGYEPFSFGNLRDVVIYSGVDNVTWNSGKHAFLAGAQVDFTDTKNGFMPLGASYYRFNSWDDFVNGAKPQDFTMTHSLLPNFEQAYPSFKFAQYSAYAQDQVSFTDKFKLTVGLRADLTTYPNVTEVKENPLVSGLTFENGIKINTGKLPKSAINWSPRVGFNWDVMGDRSFQVRGGTGIFTGRVPFVWIVGQSGNSGMLQVTRNFNGQANTPGPFNPDPRAYFPSTVPAAGTVVPSTITAFAPDFKNPQSWKSSIGLDKRLPWGLVGTLEAIYNKDTRVVYSRNVNLVDPSPLAVAGYPDNRLIYPNLFKDKYINKLTSTGQPSSTGTSAFTAIQTGNEDQGHYFSLTAKLEKQFTRGFYGQVAYTYSEAKNLYDGIGDQPVNTWNLIPSVDGPNTPFLAPAGYLVPHRVIAGLSYRKEYVKHLATQVSLFYEGASQGRYSYMYSSDLNRDGANNDLIYIPKDPSEITFGNGTATTGTAANVVIGGVTYTPQQQSDLFFKFIEQDKYLREHKGQYAERNGALLPWRNQFDVKFAQDLFTTVGGKRNTLQFTVDIFNFANLLNSNWGVVQSTTTTSGQILIPQNTSSLAPGSSTKPIFRIATDRNAPVQESFRDNLNLSSTYYMQFGLRYTFGQ